MTLQPFFKLFLQPVIVLESVSLTQRTILTNHNANPNARHAAGTLAIPFSRQDYECMLKTAGGENRPIWTGIRLTKRGLHYGTAIKTKLEDFYGRWEGGATFGTLPQEFNMTDLNDSDVKCVYFHNGWYAAANCSFQRKHNTRIWCSCAPSKSRQQPQR